MQSELTFYRDAATPLLGTTPSNPWKYPGLALSASAVRIYPGLKPLVSATWVLVWNPSASSTYNAVRLITADDGPTNETQICSVHRKDYNAPLVDTRDITDFLNEIILSGSSRHLLMQTCGDTQSKIYRSTVDLVWSEE